MESPSFINPVVDIGSLPRVEKGQFKPLAKDALYVQLIGTVLLIFILLAAVVIGAVVAWRNEVSWLPLSLVGFWLVVSVWLIYITFKGFKAAGYQVREHDLLFKSGFLWKDTVAVPYNRIQHCELNEGPIEQAFNLCTLKVFTAGGSDSDLEIKGLQKEIGEDLKTFILKKVGSYAGR